MQGGGPARRGTTSVAGAPGSNGGGWRFGGGAADGGGAQGVEHCAGTGALPSGQSQPFRARATGPLVRVDRVVPREGKEHRPGKGRCPQVARSWYRVTRRGLTRSMIIIIKDNEQWGDYCSHII